MLLYFCFGNQTSEREGVRAEDDLRKLMMDVKGEFACLAGHKICLVFPRRGTSGVICSELQCGCRNKSSSSLDVAGAKLENQSTIFVHFCPCDHQLRLPHILALEQLIEKKKKENKYRATDATKDLALKMQFMLDQLTEQSRYLLGKKSFGPIEKLTATSLALPKNLDRKWLRIKYDELQKEAASSLLQSHPAKFPIQSLDRAATAASSTETGGGSGCKRPANALQPLNQAVKSTKRPRMRSNSADMLSPTNCDYVFSHTFDSFPHADIIDRDFGDEDFVSAPAETHPTNHLPDEGYQQALTALDDDDDSGDMGILSHSRRDDMEDALVMRDTPTVEAQATHSFF